ncbi:MAG: S8 family serine peptidase [Candidatus Zixiibacteriota bacterium]
MRFLKWISLACSVIMATFVFAKAESYYGSVGPVALRVDSFVIAIKFDTTIPLQQVFDMHSRLRYVTPDSNMINGFFAVVIGAGGDLYAFLDTLNNSIGIEAAEPYYYLSDTVPAPVGSELVAGFEDWMDSSAVAATAANYGAAIARKLEYLPDCYVLGNADPGSKRLLTVANDLHDAAGVRFSHPIFGIRPVRFTYKLYDRYNGSQFHLKRVIGAFNSASVWDIHGAIDTIVVAVVDDGVTTHEDLPQSRVLPGRDFSGIAGTPYDDNPAPGNLEAHGMGCAGIIGASHTTDSLSGVNTGSGVISMSPAVEILPVKIFDDNGIGTSDVTRVADAISYAYQSGADVLSNSWGYGFTGDGFPVLNDALERASLFGRGGKGCPVIFAAGNAGTSYVLYPSNKPFCFAVGALQLNDVRWSYSCYGGDLDVVAPSGNFCLQGDVWTLDQMGTAGFNPNVTSVCGYSVTWNCSSPNDVDYDCKFGGTSATGPLVAGAAALVLAKDPGLSSNSVYYILKQSADTTLDWGTNSRFTTQYGYGRVDAFGAVLSLSHGDASNDGLLDISDLSVIVDYLFFGGQIFPSAALADCDCDGTVDNSDLQYFIDWFAFGGPLPVKPCFKL